MDKIAPESEAEYEQRREELIKDAAETKRETDQKQQDALKAIAQGEQLEDYETVYLGDLELEVKAWLPGDVADTVEQAQSLADDGEKAEIKESMETMLSALSQMTVDETYNMTFWRKFYSNYGPEGIVLAVETVMEPAGEGLQDRKEGIQSFRSDGQGR